MELQYMFENYDVICLQAQVKKYIEVNCDI